MSPLDSGRVTLDSSGNGRIHFQPPPFRQWRITLTTIQTNLTPGAIIPRCYLYKGTVLPANQVDATYQGQRNASDVPVVLNPGETLTVLFMGGTVGNVASASIEGTDVAI